MLQKIVRALPAPTWIGFGFSLIAALIGWIFSFNATAVFIILVALAWIALLFSEYKLPFGNHLFIVFCVFLGHLPYLGIKFLFF